MAASAGRDITATWGGTSLGGVRETGITMNGDAIDITDNDSNGFRELLADTARNELNISISGVSKANTLAADIFGSNADRTQTLVVTYANGDTLSATFWLASYTETGAYEDATTFAAEFQSSGTITFTAA